MSARWGRLGGCALAVAACAGGVEVEPVIDTPPSGSEAAAFAALDTIELSVALEGEPEALVSSIFRRGEPLVLRGVPYGENLVVHMLGRVNSAEVAYGRTCRFAVRAGQDPPKPHLYFARTVRWASAGVPPSNVRIGGAALASPAGAGLYVGGLDVSAQILGSADRFNPSAGRFDELARISPRRQGAAANLGNGRTIVLGGVDANGFVVQQADLIAIDSPAERAVEQIFAPQLGSRIAPALASLVDGRVAAIGGLDPQGQPARRITVLSGEGAGVTIEELDAELAVPRYGHSVTRLSDDVGAPVLIAGGRDSGGAAVATSELFRPLAERVAPQSEFSARMQVPRWDHQAVRLPDGSVLVAGGRNALGPVATLELFKLETGFVVQGTLPLGSGLTDLTATTLPDGRILLAGGRDAAGDVVDAASIVRIDSLGGGVDIVNTARLGTPRASHGATRLCDGTVLVVGGTAFPTAAERYNPPSTGRR